MPPLTLPRLAVDAFVALAFAAPRLARRIADIATVLHLTARIADAEIDAACHRGRDWRRDVLGEG